MCGFVVVLTPQQPTPLAAVQGMNTRLRHRGPDDEGYLVLDGEGLQCLGGPDTPPAVWQLPTGFEPTASIADQPRRAVHLALAHRRLAIVDLSPWGHQPMRRGARYAVAFNGEIYNHVELRLELEVLGHSFRSHSDTEVLLAAYQQWGPQALSRFNGMWAFALLDLERRQLFIARDRFGVKPLYFWSDEKGQVLLASEIKALLMHPLVRSDVDLTACQDYITEGAQAWTSGTLFRGIQRFPAGHFATVQIDRPQALQPQAYWRTEAADEVALQRPFDAREADDWAQRYRDLMQDAVRLRMRMDVRFGTALSGGLDSSQIAAWVNQELARRGQGERQEVFSSVYAQPQGQEGQDRALLAADESLYIGQVAERLGVRSNTIQPQWQGIPAAHERMIWALDLPPANTLMSSWHTYALVAQRGVVVTLDGQGADEQMAGYLRFLRNHLAHAPLVRSVGEALALARTTTGCARTVTLGLAGNLVRHLGGQAALNALEARVARAGGMGMTLQQALTRDVQTGLQTLLHYADQSAMAWSVESRMPFMDYRVMQFLAQVPYAYRVHAGWTKWLARHAANDMLPSTVLWRRDKLGWAIPEQAWFGAGAPLARWFDEQLSGSSFVQNLAQTMGRDLRAVSAAERVRWLNLAVWHRLYQEEASRPGRLLGRVQA